MLLHRPKYVEYNRSPNTTTKCDNNEKLVRTKNCCHQLTGNNVFLSSIPIITYTVHRRF